MFDLGWTEILVIGVVALIVIGPRDLPVALHTVGKYVGKLRAMARDFQQGIDDIARQHELKDVQEGINKFSSPESAIENYVNGLENTGAKPAEIDGSNPDSDIAAMVEEEHRKMEDWSAASAEIASPAAQSVDDGAVEEPAESAGESAPESTPENTPESTNAAGEQAVAFDGAATAGDEPELPLDNDRAAGDPPPPKSGQTASS